MALLAVGLIGVAGCGDDDGDGGDATEDTEETPATEGPSIEGFAFKDTTVEAGATVTVSNKDGAPHTFTADDDSFDTGRIEAGGTKELTVPGESGSYPIHCEIHPSITGELVVE